MCIVSPDPFQYTPLILIFYLEHISHNNLLEANISSAYAGRSPVLDLMLQSDFPNSAVLFKECFILPPAASLTSLLSSRVWQKAIDRAAGRPLPWCLTLFMSFVWTWRTWREFYATETRKRKVLNCYGKQVKPHRRELCYKRIMEKHHNWPEFISKPYILKLFVFSATVLFFPQCFAANYREDHCQKGFISPFFGYISTTKHSKDTLTKPWVKVFCWFVQMLWCWSWLFALQSGKVFFWVTVFFRL